MRFAYADPPYPGQAKRWYGNHPDYAGEVDHAELVARLERDYPDGWALSTAAESLQFVLSLCPPVVRVAIWNVTNRAPVCGGALKRWHPSWEPVILMGGRMDRGEAPMVRDVLSCGAPSGWLGNTITGQKPEGFSRWMFDLLGARPGDELHDLFPGSGAVGKTWEAFCRQPSLIPVPARANGGIRLHHNGQWIYPGDALPGMEPRKSVT